MELNFDKTFTILRVMLSLGHFYPGVPKDRKFFIVTYTMFTFYTIYLACIIYNIIAIDIQSRDYSTACQNCILAMAYVDIYLKAYVLFGKEHILKELLDDMKRDFECNDRSTDEQKLFLEYVIKEKTIYKQWLGLGCVSLSGFFCKPAIVMLYYYVIGDFRYVQVVELVYPAFIEDNKNNLLVYMFLFLIVSSTYVYSFLIYLSIMAMGPTFMLHACAQMDIIKNRLEQLFTKTKKVKEKLNGILKLTQHIYRFTDRINECFKSIYEMILKVSTITLAVTLYECLESLKEGKPLIDFPTFVMAATMSMTLSYICYHGQMLTQKGEDIRMALYSCGWERHYDRSTRATIIIMLTRALRPVAVNTVFRTVCLEALTDAFQQSYTIFNLMNAMFN